MARCTSRRAPTAAFSSLAPTCGAYGLGHRQAAADIDGIAFGADGNLYANTYGGNGLFRILVQHGAAGAIVKLATPRALAPP